MPVSVMVFPCHKTSDHSYNLNMTSILVQSCAPPRARVSKTPPSLVLLNRALKRGGQKEKKKTILEYAREADFHPKT